MLEIKLILKNRKGLKHFENPVNDRQKLNRTTEAGDEILTLCTPR